LTQYRIHVVKNLADALVPDSADQQVGQIALVLGMRFHELAEAEFVSVEGVD
jgi:hypothetical protein